LIVPPTGSVATSTLTQWRTADNTAGNNAAYRWAGNNFGTGNVGITQAP